MVRRLAAILAADIVGYSKAMATDEAGTLARLKAFRADVFDPLVEKHNGRIIKLMGDGTLVEFASVVDAVECAIAIQSERAESDGGFKLRIGINLGDVMIEGDDVYGDGVNVAARLEALARPGGICISDMVYQNISTKVDAAFENSGEQQLKNIERPVIAWQWTDGHFAGLGDDAQEALSLPERPSIAVLPFDNMSGDPEQEYFSDGITEDIITELSRFRELFVIARNSSFTYKGKRVKVQDVGRDLGVSYVLEGSVRKSGKRVRITAQLIEASNGAHIWAEKYDRELHDIFDLQDEITQTIVRLLPVRLHGALVETMRRIPSENLSAYDHFLHGRWLFDRTSGQDPKAIELLKKAVGIDPVCSQAHAHLALAHAYSLYNLFPISDRPVEDALSHIEQALVNGKGDHFVHAAAGFTFIMCGEHDLADTHSAEAVALNPNAIFALLGRGYVQSYLGNPAAGVEQLKNVLRYDPHAPGIYYEILAEASYILGDYEKAIDIYKRWQSPPPHMNLALAVSCAQAGHKAEANAAVERHLELFPVDFDIAQFAKLHAGMCRQARDAEHWLDGYRKTGLIN